jgi:hypothetical protein
MLLGIPAVVWDNVTGNFYGNNGLCLPLYLDEPYLNGWWYSSLLFFGVFFISVGITTFCLFQTRRYVRQHQGEDPMLETNAHASVATRYLFIIIVNLVCWLPVIVVKMMAFTSFDIGSKKSLKSSFGFLIKAVKSCVFSLLRPPSFDFRHPHSSLEQLFDASPACLPVHTVSKEICQSGVSVARWTNGVLSETSRRQRLQIVGRILPRRSFDK